MSAPSANESPGLGDRGFSAVELLGFSGELCFCVGYCLLVGHPLALHFDDIASPWECDLIDRETFFFQHDGQGVVRIMPRGVH